MDVKQWGEWHGDEYDVEYTREELYDLECQEADLQNDKEWLEDRE